MVEHDLHDLSSQQRSSAHQSLAEAVRRAVRRGSRIRYVQRILVPEESRCLCLFEAAGAELVRNVNDIAQFPAHAGGSSPQLRQSRHRAV